MREYDARHIALQRDILARAHAVAADSSTRGSGLFEAGASSPDQGFESGSGAEDVEEALSSDGPTGSRRCSKDVFVPKSRCVMA